jgi:plastocyanin
MKRREFVEKAGLGAAALVALTNPGHGVVSASAGEQHDHGPISGPLATATVSFGAWAQLPAPGGDRHPNLNATAGVRNNVHALIPNEVTIKAGGTVNYIIAGFHQIAVYDDGTTPADINTSLVIPGLPPLINDPTNRVFRGISPFVLPLLQGPTQTGPVAGTFQPILQDRVEVVHFPNPGTFLVICTVLPHFAEGMFGYVKVNP